MLGIGGSLSSDGSVVTVVDALPVRRTAVDLPATLRASLEVMTEQANACDVTLTVAISDNFPQAVLVDAGKVVWATATLVGNALRYVRHGSRTMPGGSVVVRLSYADDCRCVVIEVEDDGPGMPRERLQQLFGDCAPVGLALAMVREVAAAHGGTMEIQSDTDIRRHGTAIRLTLPVA
jgi:signal transduction histidine kinase